jgi:acyl dehydratase
MSFAGLTGIFELHTNDIVCKGSQFGRRVAGMLGLSYAHGLMWACTYRRVARMRHFLGINDWKFLEPNFIGTPSS